MKTYQASLVIDNSKQIVLTDLYHFAKVVQEMVN